MKLGQILTINKKVYQIKRTNSIFVCRGCALDCKSNPYEDNVCLRFSIPYDCNLNLIRQ